MPPVPAELPEVAGLSPDALDLLSETEMALVNEFTARRVSPGRRRHHDYAFAAFQRWCALHRIEALPATSRDVLRYLHLHYGRWGWGQMWGAVAAIRFAHVEAGHRDVTQEGRIREYLSAVRRAKGKYVEKKQMDAIRTEDVAAMARSLGTASAGVIRVRFALAVVYATGAQRFADVVDGQRLRLQMDDDAVRVTAGIRRGILDDLTPGALAAVREFAASGENLLSTDRPALEVMIQEAWARAGLGGSWAKDLARLAPADLQWLLATPSPATRRPRAPSRTSWSATRSAVVTPRWLTSCSATSPSGPAAGRY